MTEWEKLWDESVMHNDYEGMRKAFYGLKADLETYREIHVKQININHKRYEKLEAIRTGLLELIENGYIKHCVVDVMNLLGEDDE